MDFRKLHDVTTHLHRVLECCIMLLLHFALCALCVSDVELIQTYHLLSRIYVVLRVVSVQLMRKRNALYETLLKSCISMRTHVAA
jgi:branched-subunit amino acid transport protein AzlD